MFNRFYSRGTGMCIDICIYEYIYSIYRYVCIHIYNIIYIYMHLQFTFIIHAPLYAYHMTHGRESWFYGWPPTGAPHLHWIKCVRPASALAPHYEWRWNFANPMSSKHLGSKKLLFLFHSHPILSIKIIKICLWKWGIHIYMGVSKK